MTRLTRLVPIFLLLVCFSSNAIAENKSIPNGGAAADEEERFYPHKLPEQFKDMPLNQIQKWQLLFTLNGPAKKTPKWLDILLGEKTEPGRYIGSPTSIAVMEGMAYILDGDTMWVFDFRSNPPKVEEVKRKEFNDAFGMDTDGKFLYLTYPSAKKIAVFDEKMNLLKKINCVFAPQRIRVKGDKIYAVDQGLQRLANKPSVESIFILDKNTGEIVMVVGMPRNVWEEFVESGGDERVLEKKEAQQRVASSVEALTKDIQAKRDGKILLHQPSDVDVDDRNNLYVSEEMNGRILKFDSEGKFVDQFGVRAPNILGFDSALAVAVAPNGDVYGLDSGITLVGQSAQIIHLPYVKIFSEKILPKDSARGDLMYFPYAVWGGEPVLDETSGQKVPNLERPSDMAVDTNPTNIKYFQKFAAPDFEIEYLIWMTSQGGAVEKVGDKRISHGKVTVFGSGRLKVK